MRCLTIHQPYAQLCVTLPERDLSDHDRACMAYRTFGDWDCTCAVEHRAVKWIVDQAWPAPASLIGQRIAIHAGARRPPNYVHHNVNDDVPPWIDLVSMARYWDWWEHDDFHHGGVYRWRGPLGAVVGSAVLSACIPMVVLRGEGAVYRLTTDPHLLVHIDHPPWGGPREVAVVKHYPAPARSVDVTDQLPLGIFEPGRWAYLLADARPLATPIPCRGRQRFWTLPDEIAAEVEAQCRT